MFNNKMLFSNAKFAISIGSHTNGNISVSPSGKQFPGKVITITLSANTHYKFSSVTVTRANGATVPLTTVTSGSKYTFKMPASNVTVYAVFSQLPRYSITVNGAANGTLRASKTSGIYAGETITITATPNSFYKTNSISASPNVTLSGSGNTRTFVMPSNNVTVSGSFVPNFTHIATLSSEAVYVVSATVSPSTVVLSGKTKTITSITSFTFNVSYFNFSPSELGGSQKLTPPKVTRLDNGNTYTFEGSDNVQWFAYSGRIWADSDIGKTVYLRIS